MNENNLRRRLFWAVVGNLLLGVATSLLRLSSFGTDPFSCMNLGVSSHLPISYGTYQMLFNIVLFIPIFILDRKSFGVGALINMLLLGYIVDISMNIWSSLGITIEGLHGNLPVRAVLLIIGVLIICFGVAVYMESDLGAAPWDRLAVLIENLSNGNLKFKWVRMTYDCLAIAIGFVTGSTIGIATLVIGFFLGPLVSIFRNGVAKKLLA